MHRLSGFYAIVFIFNGVILPAVESSVVPKVDATGYIAEAALPVGWPVPAESGTITDVVIPAHRAAEGPGFWPLFAHITVGKIPMTAPVVMPVADEQGKTPKTMQFLYPSAITEPAPIVPGITIVDVTEQRVLRITVRGPVDADMMREKLALLSSEAVVRKLNVSGKPRLFGYNGPGVKVADRTWEICVPVTAQ